MSEEGTSARAAQLIENVRHNGHTQSGVSLSPLAVILGMATVLAQSVIVILAFTVIIARQHTIDALREQIDTDSALDQCRAVMASSIADADQNADNAERDLVALLARQIVSTTTPPNREVFLAATTRLSEANALANRATEQRSAWLQAGSPLPCPLDPS